MGWVGEARSERADVVLKEEFGRRVESEARNEILQVKRYQINEQKTKEQLYLKINWISFGEAVFCQLNGLFSMPIKDVKITDALPAEERPCNRSMEPGTKPG